MSKDWTGNKKTTFVQLGASNHSEGERETNDFYSTDPHTLEIFLEALKRDGIELHTNIWEPACGMGHLSEVLKSKGYNVYSSDLIDRGYGVSNINFLECTDSLTYDILTNPPYKYAQEFVEHALEISYSGAYVVMLLKIQFLEGKARRKLFDKYPPKYVYVNSERQTCYINGDMSKKMSSASCYCWFVWEKGFTGDPVIKWI
jgi:hypothetical protein